MLVQSLLCCQNGVFVSLNPYLPLLWLSSKRMRRRQLLWTKRFKEFICSLCNGLIFPLEATSLRRSSKSRQLNSDSGKLAFLLKRDRVMRLSIPLFISFLLSLVAAAPDVSNSAEQSKTTRAFDVVVQGNFLISVLDPHKQFNVMFRDQKNQTHSLSLESLGGIEGNIPFLDAIFLQIKKMMLEQSELRQGGLQTPESPYLSPSSTFPGMPETPESPTTETPDSPTPETPGSASPALTGTVSPETPETPQTPETPLPQTPEMPSPETPETPSPQTPETPSPQTPGTPSPEIPGMPSPSATSSSGTPGSADSSDAHSSTTTGLSLQASSAALKPPQEGDYVGQVLYNHNMHRLNHSAPLLSWDVGLAATAQRICDTCIYEHNT